MEIIGLTTEVRCLNER